MKQYNSLHNPLRKNSFIVPILAFTFICACVTACTPKAENSDSKNIDSKNSAQQNNAKEETSKTAAIAPIIAIENPRIRVPLGGKTMTAGYANIVNNTNEDIFITGGTIDIADKLELHTHEKTTDGIMQMRQVSEFKIPAGGSLSLEPMGAHLMIFDTKEGLKEGDIAHITLNRKDGQKIAIEAPLATDPTINNQIEHKH